VKPVMTIINIIVLSAYRIMCTTISHQLSNTVEWVNVKQIIQKKVVMSASPAEIYRPIMNQLLTVIVMLATIN